jgi:tripartite-type tricarboxylate transporter receptor subunit TctC
MCRIAAAGGPALIDLIAGQVQVEFASTGPTIGYIKAGTLRALAVTTVGRSPILPDLPTLSDFVPGYGAAFWRGIGAPKNTPTEIIGKLNGFRLGPRH